MKNYVLFIVLVTFCQGLFGCAKMGPSMWSKEVYRATEKAEVKGQRARGEKYSAKGEFYRTEQLEQLLAQDRMKVQNTIIINDLKKGNKHGGTIFSKEGLVSGFKVIFINKSRRDKTITIKKADSLSKRRWIFEIPSHRQGGSYKIHKMEVGVYEVSWTVGTSRKKWPKKGPDHFEVSGLENLWHDKTKTYYAGGYVLTD